ncbi:MAG TPA: HAMP domain-containing sensor histidine kinase [Kineosporiaceae bacterium]|nr:HAMP domain-containing sensor histidine kinase [Kineosporiaceae bacterium]
MAPPAAPPGQDAAPPGQDAAPPGQHGSGSAATVSLADGPPVTGLPVAVVHRPDDGGPAAHPPRTPWVTGLLDRMSLQAKLVTVLLATLAVALTITGYGVQLVLRDYLTGQLDDRLKQTTATAARNTHAFYELLGQGRLRVTGSTRIVVTIDGATSGPIIPGGMTDEAGTLDIPELAHLTSRQASAMLGRTYTVTATDGSRWRATSFSPEGELTNNATGEQGPAAVTVLESLQGVNLAVIRLRLISLLFGVLVMALCTAAGWYAIRRSFVPLREVEDTAAAIAAGDLSRRVRERPRTTEVGRLTVSLNGMLAQIEQAFRHREASEARTRRFAADASHELRTPLASIRGFAELYRQGAVPAEEVPRTMRRIEEEATRMGGLVEDLLLLARLDEQRPARTEPVDLAVLANDALHDARGLDPTRRFGLVGLDAAGGPVPAVVVGDEDRLRQVVANLMANAVRHTPPGTAVEVAVGVTAAPDAEGRTAPRAVLEVRDHGPGLTPEQAERVFERFYRVDISRTRGHGGGSGLGLSIVAAVVTAHHGRVEARPTPGGGATFRVEIPAGPPGATGPA